MEDPVAEIPHVIHELCQSPPEKQRATIEHYFTPTASFTHPFCRTGSFNGSGWLIWCIYRWYKILSPRIELEIESIAYDERTLKLYVTMRQLFRIWAIPFFRAHVELTTVLQLVAEPYPTPHHPDKRNRYYIQSQNDLYQVNEWIKLISPFGILSLVVLTWQLIATGFCVLGAVVMWPVSWVEQNVIGGNNERSIKDAIIE